MGKRKKGKGRGYGKEGSECERAPQTIKVADNSDSHGTPSPASVATDDRRDNSTCETAAAELTRPPISTVEGREGGGGGREEVGVGADVGGDS